MDMDVSNLLAAGAAGDDQEDVVPCAQSTQPDPPIAKKKRVFKEFPVKSVFCTFKTVENTSSVLNEPKIWSCYYLLEASVHYDAAANVYHYMFKAKRNILITKWIKLMNLLNGFSMFKGRYSKHSTAYKVAQVSLEDYKQGMIACPSPTVMPVEPSQPLEPPEETMTHTVVNAVVHTSVHVRSSPQKRGRSKSVVASSQHPLSQRDFFASQERDLSLQEQLQRVFIMRSGNNPTDFVELARHYFSESGICESAVFLERFWMREAHVTVLLYEGNLSKELFECVEHERAAAFDYKYLAFDAMTQLLPCIADMVFYDKDKAGRSLACRMHMIRQEIDRLNVYYRKLQFVNNELVMRDLVNIPGVTQDVHESHLLPLEPIAGKLGLRKADPKTLYGMYFEYVKVVRELMSQDSMSSVYYNYLALDGTYKSCSDALTAFTAISRDSTRKA
jgi:hypothetical protein